MTYGLDENGATMIDGRDLTPSLGALLGAVRQHRAKGEWQQALTDYAEIRQRFPTSRIARESLVAVGRIRLRNLNQPVRVLAQFEQDLESGETTLIQEALIGKVQTLKQLHRTESEKRVL